MCLCLCSCAMFRRVFTANDHCQRNDSTFCPGCQSTAIHRPCSTTPLFRRAPAYLLLYHPQSSSWSAASHQWVVKPVNVGPRAEGGYGAPHSAKPVEVTSSTSGGTVCRLWYPTSSFSHDLTTPQLFDPFFSAFIDICMAFEQPSRPQKTYLKSSLH